MTANEQALRQRYTALRPEPVDGGYWELEFKALGSDCELFFAAATEPLAQQFCRAALDWLASFEAGCSRFLPDSQLSAINAQAGIDWVQTDPQIEMLLGLCDHSHFVTGGAFDATSLPLSRLWDWRQQRDSLPTPDEVKATLEVVGWKRIQRAPGRIFLPQKGMMLDFGGVGKEFAVDCLLQIGLSHGLQNLMVDLGGDIAVQGQPPEGGSWYVGLENPANIDECYCGIRLNSGTAVATSGDYRRCFQYMGKRYGHILDCRTGWPVANGTSACTVIAPRCTSAGLLSTSAMVTGGQAAIDMLERSPGAQGCLWANDRLLETRGFRRTVLPRGWDD
jgi:FAD:protein FMN transferase